MLQLLRSKIESISFNGNESISELMKLLGISIYVIDEESRGCTPPYKEYLIAATQLKEYAERERPKGNEDEFTILKAEMLAVFDKLIVFFKENGLDKPSIMDLMSGGGEKRKKQENEIKYALLMVEQNHIDFFKNRSSRFQSQPHERFSAHYWIRTVNNISTFGFLENSGLPEDIKTETIQAIKEASEKFD